MERQPGMELGIASPCWAVAEQASAGRAPAVAAVSWIFVVWSVGRSTLDSHAKCRRRTRPAKPVAAHCSSSIFALLTILVNLARSVLIGAANRSGVEMKVLMLCRPPSARYATTDPDKAQHAQMLASFHQLERRLASPLRLCSLREWVIGGCWLRPCGADN